VQIAEKGLSNVILNTDALTGLKQLEANSVDCCITSPPYWALRKYGVPVKWDDGWEGELGLEPTFQLYIQHLLQIFDEVKRVLKKEGSCWVVISDTYSGTGHKGEWRDPKNEDGRNGQDVAINNKVEGIPEKSLCMIPERFAMGMIDHGWILRNKVVWHKKNCMPSSAKDRLTVDYENVYFFTKSQRYYFNTQYEPYQTHEDRPMGIYRANNWGYVSKYANTPYYGNGKKEYKENDVQNPSDVKRRILESMKKNMPPIGGIKQAGGQNPTYSGNRPEWKGGRIKRAVWSINTKPFPKAHFAVFPEKL
jgi:DNA modification methylase